ncbi:hypothetical protein ALQ84_00948, partial [Pseudomonas caricapapayae]
EHDSVITDDYRSSRSSVGMQFTTLCVARGRWASRSAYPAKHGHDSVIPYDYRSSRSSVGMQFTTLCVARERGASRSACPRGAWAR